VEITVRFVGSEKTLRELSQLDFPSGNIHDPKDPNLKPIAQQKILDNLDQLSTPDNSTIDQFNQVLKLLTQVSLIAQKSPNNLPHTKVCTSWSDIYGSAHAISILLGQCCS
jgi:hypothetical protein